MPKGPAARLTDNVAHPLPPVLTGGPGSENVLIGKLPPWRRVPAAAAKEIVQAMQVEDRGTQFALITHNDVPLYRNALKSVVMTYGVPETQPGFLLDRGDEEN